MNNVINDEFDKDDDILMIGSDSDDKTYDRSTEKKKRIRSKQLFTKTLSLLNFTKISKSRIYYHGKHASSKYF